MGCAVNSSASDVRPRQLSRKTRNVEPNAQHGPALLRPALHRMPASFLRSIHTSLGHLIAQVTAVRSASAASHTATAAASGSERRGARPGRGPRPTSAGREPGRRDPGAALAAAARALLVRGHERAVGAPRRRPALGPLVGGVGQAMVYARPAEPRVIAARRRTSSSGSMPSVAAASPRLIAMREHAVGVLVDDQPRRARTSAKVACRWPGSGSPPRLDLDLGAEREARARRDASCPRSRTTLPNRSVVRA